MFLHDGFSSPCTALLQFSNDGQEGEPLSTESPETDCGESSRGRCGSRFAPLTTTYVIAEASLLAILLNDVLMPFATLPMPTVAAKAIKATTRAYSIKSCPLSSSRI